MYSTILALIASALAFSCFVLAARVEWKRIKSHDGKLVWLPSVKCEIFIPHSRIGYNLAVILQWVSLALFVYTVFQAAAALK